MKCKNLTGLIIIFLCIILINTLSVVTADPTIMVTSYQLEPETLLSGDEAVLQVTLTNTELTATQTNTDYVGGVPINQIVDTIAASINNVYITADGDGTNTIKATDNYEDIGDLSPGSSITLSFVITADKNISAGLYTPVLNVNVKDYQDVAFPIPVRISSYSATILTKDVPKKISSSGSTTITLTAVNNRETTVKDVTITANTDQSISVSPQSTYIGTLASESSQDISYSIHPSTLGEEEISFTISYRNGENAHSTTIDIPIEVIETTDVAPIFTNLPVSIKKGGSSRIDLEVYNAKTDSITGVIITPLIDTTVIPSQYFIGAMNPDDVFSASFDLYTDTLEYGNHTIEFMVSYKQGNEYFESPSISHEFSVTSEEGVIYQTSSSSDTDSSTEFAGDIMTTCLPIIGVIVILIVALILWRWKKGRKDQ